MVRNYYMVRGMDSSEAVFNELLKNEVVAVGWSYIDFTLCKDNREKFDAELEKVYFKNSKLAPSVKGKWRNQSFRFCGIKKGDYIVVPYHQYIILAEAVGEQIYKPEVINLNLANQQKVQYLYDRDNKLVKIPRASLPENMQRKLRVLGSIVTDFSEFKNEIDTIFASGKFSYKNIHESQKEQKITDFKKTLLNNIRNGHTNLKAGGRGLEELVSELLEIEGYKTKILGKSTFSGIADVDIEAEKIDQFFGEQKLFVQVKHHQGESSDWGLEQLKAAKNILDKDNKDFQLVFITTAGISDDVIEKAYENNIVCIDGQKLVDWLYDNLTSLSELTKEALHIIFVPQIIDK